jgi:hypothetical protein
VDLQRLRQVLHNLVSNALKYSLQGAVKLTCAVKLDDVHQKASIEMVVQDEGVGIKSDLIEHVFQAYTRVDTVGLRSTSVEGAGLGLSIVSSVTRSLCGRLRVCSASGVGSAFALDLLCDVVPADIKTAKGIECPTRPLLIYSKESLQHSIGPLMSHRLAATSGLRHVRRPCTIVPTSFCARLCTRSHDVHFFAPLVCTCVLVYVLCACVPYRCPAWLTFYRR